MAKAAALSSEASSIKERLEFRKWIYHFPRERKGTGAFPPPTSRLMLGETCMAQPCGAGREIVSEANAGSFFGADAGAPGGQWGNRRCCIASREATTGLSRRPA